MSIIAKEPKIADRIRELREMKGITQQSLADLIGVSRVTVGAYEKGSATPSVDTLVKISKKYKISMDWLCCLEEENMQVACNAVMTYKDIFVQLSKILSELQSVIGVEYEKEATDVYAVTYEVSPHAIEGVQESCWIRFCICDEHLHSAFSDYKTMNDLLKKGTITNKLYDSWYEGFLQKLSNIPTPESLTRGLIEMGKIIEADECRIQELDTKESLTDEEKEELNILKSLHSKLEIV